MERKNTTLLSIIASTLLLTACGGSTEQSNTAGRISLNITDAPVDHADAVVVEFTSVTLKPADGDEITFTFGEDDPLTTDVDESVKSIDLLALQGIASQPLLENVEIPAGPYNQISLGVNAEFDDVMDSFITIDGTQYELRVPSGSQSGLKLNTPFTVAAGTEGVTVADEDSVYTIDFDLRKSVVDPIGHQDGYFLKPVLRLVQNVNTGSISGLVDVDLLTGQHCSDEDHLTGNAVYIFAGHDVTPDDVTAADVNATDIDPITTSLVSENKDQDGNTVSFSYEFGYLAEGSYTIAFTCAADLDDENDQANTDDGDPNTDEVVFDVFENVDVVAGENTDFPLPLPLPQI
ncbi:MAG: DUF4382 domain-containing protein [Gammaproteobacteria bacterium]|nr:DUF4382 domain-containing protein [Gammaproteobacteria bacterium]